MRLVQKTFHNSARYLKLVYAAAFVFIGGNITRLGIFEFHKLEHAEAFNAIHLPNNQIHTDLRGAFIFHCVIPALLTAGTMVSFLLYLFSRGRCISVTLQILALAWFALYLLLVAIGSGAGV
jgi:hypothetical protein